MTDAVQPPVYSAPATPPERYARPPLTPRAKRGAAIAGIVGFLMLSLGWTLIVIPVVVAGFAAFALLILSAIGSGSSGTRTSDAFSDMLGNIHAELWVIPLIISAVLGIALMIGGILTSRGILKSHGVSHPTGVTWAGFGIAVVAHWIVSGIFGMVFGLFSSFGDSFGDGYNATIVIVLALSCLAALVLSAVLGWLSWWWMAHAMRPAAVE